MKHNTWYALNVYGDQGLIADETTGANIAVSYEKKDASLIAAAPEMYEALKLFVGLNFPADSIGAGFVNVARAAIAKAEGKE